MPSPRMPSIESIKRQKATGEASDLPALPSQTAMIPPAPSQRRGLPPMPRPGTLTAGRKVLNEDTGEWEEQERAVVLQNRDIRYLKHLIEFGDSTRGILALLAGASQDNTSEVATATRARIKRLEDAGLIDVDGRGRSAIVSATELAHAYYPHTYLNPDFLPHRDQTHLLNVSACSARVSRPHATDHPFGARFVGWPVLSAARTASDFATTFGSERVGRDSIVATQKAAEYQLMRDGYPTSADPGNMSTRESDDIDSRLHNLISLNTGYVAPGTIWQTLDGMGHPLATFDFITFLPAVDSKHPTAIACLVLSESMSETQLISKLRALTTHSAPFNKIAVFVPSIQTDIALIVKKSWKRILQLNMNATRQYGESDLLLYDYEPSSIPGITPSFAGVDKLGGVKSWARG